jgi:hypothetical protein
MVDGFLALGSPSSFLPNTVYESGSTPYICNKLAGGKLSRGVNSPEYGEYLGWLAFAEAHGTGAWHLLALGDRRRGWGMPPRPP